MPYTIKTDNPLLIPPKDMWRVVQIEVRISWIGEITIVGEEPKYTKDFPLLCDAIAHADMRNMERKSNKENPCVIFDDRGTFICNPLVGSRAQEQRELMHPSEEGWKPHHPHCRRPRS